MPTSPPESVEIYDTTLRDGSQLEGISLTVEDKLRIAEQLDQLYHDMTAGKLDATGEWHKSIKAIKDKYPKE